MNNFTKIILFFAFICLFQLSCKNGPLELTPVAKFSTPRIDNNEVEFRNASLNATEYIWDFGDGNTSTEENPIHIYSNIGDFSVTLTAIDGQKSDQETAIVPIGKVYPPNLLELDFPPFLSRAEGVSFTWNGKAYVGFGTSNFQGRRDLWEFNPADESWTQKSDSPRDFNRAASFVINGKAYFGIGQTPWGALSKEFFEYDIANDTYTSIGNFNGNSSNDSYFDVTSFAYHDKGYIVYHNGDYSNSQIRMIEFDPSNNSWDDKGLYPGQGGVGMYHFILNDKIYMGLGNSEHYNALDSPTDFWEYNAVNNTWNQLADFPSKGRREGVSFTYDGKGYIAFGFAYDNTNFNNDPLPEIWEYDSSLDEWTRLENLPITIVNQPYHFILGNKFYFGGGLGLGGTLNDFYRYEF